MALLELSEVGFAHGAGRGFELRVANVRIDAGERVACIGPSGSGKTTLLHLLAGIHLPQRGAVCLGGAAWSSMADARRRRERIRRVGLVFQDFELLDYLTVLDNVLVPYHVQTALKLDGAVRRRAEELLEAAGISRYRDRKPAVLSQGERQRVALCRALVTEPQVVLADEPTGNLDPTNARKVLDLLLDQARERGTTLVMVTHDHGLLSDFDRVLEISAEHGAYEVRPQP